MKKHRITIHTKKQKASVIIITLILLISLPVQVHALTSLGTPQTLDSTLSVGKYTSLAIVNGYPAISYHNGSEYSLKFVRATNASGTSWGTPQTVDINGNVGYYTSLAVVNGRPAISYYEWGNSNLKFIRANNADGTSWGTPQTLDSTGVVGWDTSLVIVNGYPAISYYDQSNGDLKFIRANDADGTSWGTPQTLDSTGMVGRYTSLAIINGYPAISYFDRDNGNLKFIRATNASGTSWGTPQTLDSAGDVGYLTSQAIANGYPAISYYDRDNGNLKFIRANDADGTSWGTPQTLDSTGTVGRYTSLAIINGYPAISYYDDTNGDLKLIRANDADGTSWGSPLPLDSAGDVGEYTSLAIVNGTPAISYFDYTNGDLKYINIIYVDIAVANAGTSINNGDTLNFGTTSLNNPVTRTLTITNNGISALDLTGLSLPAGYSFTGSIPTEVAAGGSENIVIELKAVQTGTFTGNLEIGSTDTNLSPFTIALNGTVTQNSLETDIIAPLNGSTVLDSEIQVVFNHDVLHDGSAEAANNPINYLLVEDGTNGLFDTTTCLLGLAGDDVQQPISSVTYDDSTFTATLNTGTLPSGRYQLLVCGTASIEDTTGNVLNGGAFDSSTTFTVVSAAGSGSGSGSGASSASGASVALLPATGFAPHRNTLLDEQPAELAYSDMDSLSLQIPSLKVDVPIVGVPQNNTGWDVTWLTNGQAGWLNGTAYPTWDGNTVLTGHVTNASGNPGPFANIKSLKFGDQLTIQAYGETYTYEVRENKLVTSDDMSIIEEHKSRDWVTLITCEYFNETTGQYLYRRVVRAVLIVVN
jgi:LPXTG-site transpeptidase (sortase) family protein